MISINNQAPNRPAISPRPLWLTLLTCLLGLLGLTPPAQAFSLSGPFAPWMTTNLSYGINGEVGGPMALNEEYRWNMPIMTYGFDKSFVDYFGPQGIEAVEDAIAMLNRLPAASNVPFDAFLTSGAIRINHSAEAAGVIDVKSVTLHLLLQRMGLAPPTRNIFVLRRWDPVFFSQHPMWQSGYWMPPDVFSRFILMRNYDPVTLHPSPYLNGALFSFELQWGRDYADAVERPIGIEDYYVIADAQYWLRPGSSCLAITRDDIGGLAYLLNRTNLNVEVMDESVTPLSSQTALPASAPTTLPDELVSANTSLSSPFQSPAWLRRALRPGIEKVTFRRHRTDANGRFLPVHWLFKDSYFVDGNLHTATVRRLVTQPDIVFSAQDLGCSIREYQGQPRVGVRLVKQSPVRWANYGALNGKPGAAGPGVIQPGAQITFQTTGKYLAAAGGYGRNLSASAYNWGRINWGIPGGFYTNVTTFAGSQTNLSSLVLDRQTITNFQGACYKWTVLGWESWTYRLDVSRDKVHWTTAGSVGNTNGVFTFTNPVAGGPYLRAIRRQR